MKYLFDAYRKLSETELNKLDLAFTHGKFPPEWDEKTRRYAQELCENMCVQHYYKRLSRRYG